MLGGFVLMSWTSTTLAAVDLTSVGTSGTINGALAYQYTIPGAGSGAVNEFVRYQKANANTTQGYNTDFGTFEFDEVSGCCTHSILFSSVPLKNIGGTNYREFALDINESGGTQSKLSLDDIEVYLGNAPNLTGYPAFGGNASLVWDIDGAGDDWIQLDGDVSGSGSGKFDMLLYVPDALFTAANPISNPFLYLYSQVGLQGDVGQDKWTNSDGFEGWALSTEISGDILQGINGGPGVPIPEPISFSLLAHV